MDNKKILEILSDQAFFTNILSMKTPQQVQDAFLEKNINLSIDEIKVLGDLVNLIREQKNQPLSEAELDNVSGGIQSPSSEGDQPSLPASSMNTISGSEEAIAMLGGAIVGAANLADKESQKKEILWAK